MIPAGLVLAGGQSRRMGGVEKSLVDLAGQPMLAHVLARVQGGVTPLAINANGDPARFAAFGLTVIPDTLPGFAGPLAGLLAGLEWCAAMPAPPRHLLTVPSDTPFLPRDLVTRLTGAARPGKAIIAASHGRMHPVAALWPVTALPSLRAFLATPDNRSVMGFLRQAGFTALDIPCPDGRDPFANINTPDDLAAAARRLAEGGEP